MRDGDADVAAIDSHLFAALASDELVVVERLGPSPSQPLAARARGSGRTSASGSGRRWRLWRRRLRDHLGPVDDATYDPIRAMRAAAADARRVLQRRAGATPA